MSAAERVEARDWLRFAREDLEAAEKLSADADSVPRHACFLAQQAAEKALKAALIVSGVHFPRTHDLDALRNLLPDDWSVKGEQRDLAELSGWATEARYPADLPDATPEDAKQAVSQARALYESVQAAVESRSVALEAEDDGEETT
jgi:HEPN domain-containing protein